MFPLSEAIKAIGEYPVTIKVFRDVIAQVKVHVNKEEYGPGQSLDARLGNGQGQIKLETFSGNIKVELQ